MFFHKSFNGICGEYWFQCDCPVLMWCLHAFCVVCRFFGNLLGFQVLFCFLFRYVMMLS